MGGSGRGAIGREFRVLGPLEVLTEGLPVRLGGPRLRGVLARLLVDAGRTVSTAQLVEALWGARPPTDAERTVRTYVSRLRAALSVPVGAGRGRGAVAGAAGPILTRPPGYSLGTGRGPIDAGSVLIDAGSVLIDSVRFERLAADGRAALDAGEPEPAARWLLAALELWRGAAYAGVPGGPEIEIEAARLERLRLQAVEDRIAAELALGRHARLVTELTELTGRYPVRERFWEYLLVALDGSGRRADALAAFGTARQILLTRFGIEPSPRLAAQHRRIRARQVAVRAPGSPWPVLTG